MVSTPAEKKKSSKSKMCCCVPGCNSRSSKCPELSFHSFPKKKTIVIINEHGARERISVRRIWEITLKMGRLSSDFMRVCSLHFTESDYFQSREVVKKRFLKGTAIPSLNLPITAYTTAEEKERENERQLKIKEEINTSCG